MKCGKCKFPFQVSPEAFRNNCMLVFAVYSLVPLWVLSTVLLYVVPLPDPRGSASSAGSPLAAWRR